MAASDGYRRRVPNALIVAAACLQMLWASAAMLGAGWQYPPLWPGWGLSLAGFLVAVLFVPLWMRRAMGAGDVKAIAIYGLILGPKMLLLVLAVGSLLAGVHAALYLLAARWWAPAPQWRRVPYVSYLAAGALSVALMPLNSPWSS
ncbi:A24 family peptidase [Bordetella petrii]|nr:A24 family peptidase [Bordetella petrii]